MVDGSFISGFGIEGRGGIGVVSHLSFADTSLIFCGVLNEELCWLRVTLVLFESVSGLKINLQKSEIILVDEVENVEMLAANLECSVGSLPSTYLVLPLRAKYKSI